MYFEEKTILVTGASSGIGLALAKDLAKRGGRLILCARSTEKLDQLAETIRGMGRDAHVFTCDLSLPGSADGLYGEIRQAGLNVDVLINNAGYGRWGEFTAYGGADYARMIQLNITSLTELCRLFIPDMVKRGHGGVINVGSVASFMPIPYAAVYASSKSYVLLLTEALRYEYDAAGIRIMALCPGNTRTNFASVASEKSEIVAAQVKKWKQVSTDDSASAQEVAHQGLEAFEKDKMYVITGKQSKFRQSLVRLLSRETVLKLAGKQFGKVVGK